MKRLLAILVLLSIGTVTHAATIETQSPTAVNDGLPKGYPTFLFIERVPFGSGTPAVGATNGYERATHVANGLYHVPGYLPYGIEAEAVTPRVVRLPCVRASMNTQSVWVCKGYAVTPDIGRGENILIQPEFQGS